MGSGSGSLYLSQLRSCAVSKPSPVNCKMWQSLITLLLAFVSANVYASRLPIRERHQGLLPRDSTTNTQAGPSPTICGDIISDVNEGV